MFSALAVVRRPQTFGSGRVAVLVAWDMPLEDLSHSVWASRRRSRNHLQSLSAGSSTLKLFMLYHKKKRMVQYGHSVKELCLKTSHLPMRGRNPEGKKPLLSEVSFMECHSQLSHPWSFVLPPVFFPGKIHGVSRTLTVRVCQLQALLSHLLPVSCLPGGYYLSSFTGQIKRISCFKKCAA